MRNFAQNLEYNLFKFCTVDESLRIDSENRLFYLKLSQGAARRTLHKPVRR